MFWQKDRLHSADATTIPVDIVRRDLWMFLHEAYFVWLPTMYFHCAGCAHLCPGLRSLGCGWVWEECSPRLLGSRKPFTCRSSREFLAICGCVWWVRVCLYHFALPEKAGFSLAADAAEKPLSFDISSFVPISRWRCRVLVNVLLQFSRGHFIVVVFLAPAVCTSRDPPKFCTI